MAPDRDEALRAMILRLEAAERSSSDAWALADAVSSALRVLLGHLASMDDHREHPCAEVTHCARAALKRYNECVEAALAANARRDAGADG
jgi:hypothetical protein